MPQKSRNRKLPRTALSAVSGIALIIGGAAAGHAADGDEDGNQNPYAKFFNNMMSNMGLRDRDAGIDYKERPPLVVPPTHDLPAPKSKTSPAAKDPSWPTDPDGKRRTADGKGPAVDRRVLAGAKADNPAGPPPNAPRQDDNQQGGMWSSFTNWTLSLTGNNRESTTFVREPSRNALTDPPVGYRTPSPSQPYGINGLADKSKNSTGESRQADTINGPPTPH